MVGPIWVNRQGQINVGDPNSSPAYGETKVGAVTVAFSDSVLTASRGGGAVSFSLVKALEAGKSPVLVPAHEGRERAIVVLVRPPEIAGLDRSKKFETWLLLNTKAIGAP